MTMQTCIHNSHHSKELVAFIQVGHDDTLTFGNVPIGAHEMTIFPQGSDLMQRKLILRSKRSSRVQQHERYPPHACV